MILQFSFCPALVKKGIVFALCLMTSACMSLTTDTEMAGSDRPSIQKVLTAAAEIRKLIGNSETQLPRDQKDLMAKNQFESGLSAWRGITPTMLSGNDFNSSTVKLFDAYTSYLIEAKKPSLAINVLRTAIVESANARSYKWGVVFRTQLSDLLASIGQIEMAQNVLDEAQALSDRVYGKLETNSQNPDLFQIAQNASIISASIRSGGTIDKNRLLIFSNIYNKTADANPLVRFITPTTDSSSVQYVSHLIKDHEYYRRDQEYWRWFAIGALRAGDARLARQLVEQMLKSADLAGNNTFADDKEWKGNYAWQAKIYMSNFYLSPDHLKHQKFADTAFSLETKFDSLLAGAEIYLMLDEPALAEKLISRASDTLTNINAFSIELQKLGHLGLNVEQRAGELKRVTAKLYIKNKRWHDALVMLDQYIAWSEIYRNSLSLEERLPYFRGQSQGAYHDAILARASLFASEPLESNFILALDALGKLKSRQLIDALEAGGKTKIVQGVSTKSKLDSIIKDSNAFLSIADTGANLIVFFADRNGNKIRIIRKPNEFDKKYLFLRNGLAEHQFFDSANVRKTTSLVLGELEAKIFEKQRLVVEIDGSLSFLPLELWLNSKMIPLGENTAVSYIPTLGMANLSHTTSAAKGMLAIGDAQFDQKQQINAIGAGNELALRGKRGASGFSPLPETREEINSILKNVREGGKAILGNNATKSVFFREAHTSYRYLHFATHGVVGGEIPRLNEPALVLTPENNDPGFLTATEIGKMNITADLVVLSACNSGNGEYFNGEGLMGLGRAFILAGSKAVVVSLWPVDSNTTKELMVRFYRELEATGDAPLALAIARKSVMKGKTQTGNELRSLKRHSDQSVASDFNGRKNPFFWAPFVLIEAGL